MLGGTFDPIHLGHLAAARAAIECAELDRVLLIPAGRPPHRRAAVADATQRLEMCRLAIGEDGVLEVSDVEVRRGGISYTADTLRELKRMYPDDELFLVLGWDAARLFATWHEPDEVRRLATIVVVTRPGSTSPDAEALKQAGLEDKSVILCARPTPDISGSALRRAIAKGEPVADRLPAAVEQYIAKNRLYVDNR
jgi:nicotinate-nucleotide adenylyltransferase